MLADLLVEACGQAALAHVRAAGVGRDREAGRHRDAELRHLGEADPLAAEEIASAVGGLVEGVYVAGHGRTNSVIHMRMDSPQIVGLGGYPGRPMLDHVLGLARGARVLYVPTAANEEPGRALELVRAAPRRRCELTPLVLPLAAGRSPRADARARRRDRVRGGNTANMLAIWRVHGFDAILREAWESGVLLTRLERRDDLLVRGRRHRLVRAAARRDARRPRLPAGQRVPALRRRGAAAAGLPASSCATGSRPGSRSTTRAGAHYVGAELHEVVASRRARAATASAPDGRESRSAVSRLTC